MSFFKLPYRGETVFGAHPACARNPVHTSLLARFVFDQVGSANMVRDLALVTIWEWSAYGGEISLTPSGLLDLERMETNDEHFVFLKDGKPALLEPEVPLLRIDDCWGRNSRRTLNRLRKRIATPSAERTDQRLPPMLFWLDTYRKIRMRGVDPQKE